MKAFRRMTATGTASAMFLTALFATAQAGATPAPMVPLRAAAEASGAVVTWDNATQTATVRLGANLATVTIGQQTARIGGRELELGQPVTLVDGKTMVPLTFFTEGLGVMSRFDVKHEPLFAPAWAPQFDALLGQATQAAEGAGLSVGVAQNGNPILLRSHGARNSAKGLPMTANTVMGIGSTTKTFTAVAIMQLQEAGKLSVEDSVQKYLPEYTTTAPDWAKATKIKHLLTHSAGLPAMPTLFFAMADSLKADPDAPEQLKQFPAIRTAQEWMGFIAQSPVPLIAEPGAYFSYSNDSYALLGEIVARVSGQRYEEYVTEHILKPAGMNSSTFDHEAMLQMAEQTTLYAVEPDPAQPGAVKVKESPVWWEGGPAAAAGFLRSTVQDMLRFAEIFRTGGEVGGVRILSKESVEAMTTPYLEAETGVWYGYGLFIRPDYHGMKVIEHGGANKGTQAAFTVIPEKGLAAVGLSNYGGAPTDLLVRSALNLSSGLPMMAKHLDRQPVTLNESQLKRFEGIYAGGEAAPFQVKVVNGQLIFEQPGLPLPAIAVSETDFVVDLGVAQLTFQFIERNGEVFGLRAGYRILLKQ